MVNRLVYTLLLIIGYSNPSFSVEYDVNYTESIIQAELFILKEQNDSANNIVQKLSFDTNTVYLDELNSWFQKKNNYDLSRIMLHVMEARDNRDDYLNDFVEREIIIPKLNVFDPDYIELRIIQMDFLLDIGKSVQSDSLNNYISNHLKSLSHNIDGINLTKFYFKLNQYAINLANISNDYDLFQVYYQRNKELSKTIPSFEIDVALYNNELINHYMKSDLDGYIKTSREFIDFYVKNDSNSAGHYNCIIKLIDVLIFNARDNNSIELESEIFSLLIKVNKSPHYEIQKNVLSYFIQYFQSYSPESNHGKEILKINDVNTLNELCQKYIEQIEDLHNVVDLSNEYGVISRALERHNYLKESIIILKRLNNKQKEKYTSDLSNSIAQLKIRQEEKKNKNILLLEKHKQDYYLLLVSVLVLGLIIAFFAFRNQRETNRKLIEKDKVKELLLKEIHHRVKNNFQIAIGLIDLQFRDIEDEKTLSLLSEWKGKIKSMIMVHQNLYQNDDLSVDMKSYVSQIVNDITYMYSTVKCKSSIYIKPDLLLDIDSAVNLGLVLNELINNAFKYGTIDQNLEIEIHCLPDEKGYKFHFFDKGEGISGIENIFDKNTFGLKLLKELSKQMGGVLSFQNKKGAHFYIDFIQGFK